MQLIMPETPGHRIVKKGDGTKGCKNTYTTWKYRLSEGKLGDVVQNLDSGYIVKRASLVAQLVKNLPTMRETWV